MGDIATLTMNPALDVNTATATLVPGHKLRCGAPREDPGGGGINVARTIHALGGSATALFPAGGPTGGRLQALLAEAGLPCSCIPIAGSTRESFTVDETTTGRQYRFVLPGPSLAPSEITACLQRIADLDPRPRWLVLSGSLPPGVPVDFPLQVGTSCRSLGIELLLDTSGPALSHCNSLDAFLIKPSLHELETAIDRPLPDQAAQVAAARELLDRRFARAIVVSLGGRGALLVTAAGERRFPAMDVTVRSTVGAGDSMLAAIALGLSHGMKLADAVRLGTAAGAAALMAPGTSLAHLADVERLYGGPISGPPVEPGRPQPTSATPGKLFAHPA